MKEQITKKLIELLNTMKYEDISVSLLCEKCSTSRTTFYKHFKNIDDVFYELENKIISDLEKLYKDNNSYGIEEINSKTELSNLREMYKYIYDHKDIFVFMYSDNCPKSFLDKATKIVMDKLYSELKNFFNDKQAREASLICTNFIIATTKSLVTDEYSLSPKQLSILFRNLILHLINNKETYF